MKFFGRLFVYIYIVALFLSSNCFVLCKTKANLDNKNCEATKSNNGSTLKTEVIAVNREIHTFSPQTFKFEAPINKCKPEDCKYCCLKSNKCGKKSQCELSK